MKKFMAISVVLSILCMLAAGCAGGGEAVAPINTGITTGTVAGSMPGASSDARDEVVTPAEPETGTPTETATGNETEVKAATSKPAETFADVKVDVDLMAMSDILARAELNNLRTNSDQYIGKTIKMSGSYYSLFLPETSQEYHFISFSYADACCRSGLEFKLVEDDSTIGKYPEQNKNIVIIGTVGKYEEWGATYAYLEVDKLAVI